MSQIRLDVFLQAVYNVTVYFKGSGVRPDHINKVYVVGPIPPLARNCEREDFIVYGHCPTT